jgi:hypothetical protein
MGCSPKPATRPVHHIVNVTLLVEECDCFFLSKCWYCYEWELRILLYFGDRDIHGRIILKWVLLKSLWIWGCIQKFPDWPPRARTTNGTALCHYVQLYPYFVSQSSEFCRHNPLYCFSVSNTKGKRIFRYRLTPETFGYTLVYQLYCIQ